MNIRLAVQNEETITMTIYCLQTAFVLIHFTHSNCVLRNLPLKLIQQVVKTNVQWLLSCHTPHHFCSKYCEKDM